MKQFEVIDCSQESDEQNEYLGTKKKFWFKNRENGRLWLFKESREGTGEHWSEKVAEQLCILLSIPHARYELARRNQKHGVVTEKLGRVDIYFNQITDAAMHINEENRVSSLS